MFAKSNHCRLMGRWGGSVKPRHLFPSCPGSTPGNVSTQSAECFADFLPDLLDRSFCICYALAPRFCRVSSYSGGSIRRVCYELAKQMISGTTRQEHEEWKHQHGNSRRTGGWLTLQPIKHCLCVLAYARLASG